eukprot:7633460-Lingulodinium_polyedra.AAC.1
MLLLYIKADWAEMCERFGYPTWQSSLRPCLCCSCPPAPRDLYKVRGRDVRPPVVRGGPGRQILAEAGLERSR